MSEYVRLLRGPAGRLMLTSGAARLAFGIAGLAFIVYVEERTGSFAIAGVVIGAFGLTSGLLAPARGLLIDRFGGAALVTLTAGYGAANAAMALTASAGPDALSYTLLSAVAGAFAPPFSGWTRAALSAHVRGRELRTAFAVDGVLEEAAFVLGPLLAGLMIAIASARLAILFEVGLALAGALALAYASSLRDLRPLRRGWDGDRRALARRLRRAWNGPLIVATATLLGLGAALGFLELAVTAFSEERDETGAAGIVLAAFSAAGIAGAIVYGARDWRASAAARYAALLAWTGLGLALLPLASSTTALAALVIVPGLAFTAIIITNSILVDQLSRGRPTAAAFGGVTTAMNGGFALGGAVAGSLVEGAGTDTAFLVAAAVILVSVVPALTLPREAGALEGVASGQVGEQ
jgi:MFS family permease